MLPKDHPHKLLLKRDEIRSAIERVAQFADERSRAIRVQFGPGEVKVHSSLSETGESEESIPAEYAGAAARDRFQRAVPARFSARLAGAGCVSVPRSARAPAKCGRSAQESGTLPLRGHADAHLTFTSDFFLWQAKTLQQ